MPLQCQFSAWQRPTVGALLRVEYSPRATGVYACSRCGDVHSAQVSTIGAPPGMVRIGHRVGGCAQGGDLIEDPEGLVDASMTRERLLWQQVDERVDRRTADTIHDLYAMNGGYAVALLDLCDDLGYVVHHNQWRGECARSPDNPRHHCSETYPLNPRELARIDHVVLLRRADYSAWALLSQPYDATGRGTDLGPAPYGHGTVAELFTSSAQLRGIEATS